jgi:hypothetical protein
MAEVILAAYGTAIKVGRILEWLYDLRPRLPQTLMPVVDVIEALIALHQ